MSVTHIQCGVVNHRINRQPLDAESVLHSYSDIIERTKATGDGTTSKGTFYAGLITSVINDENAAYNGPYYISYGIDAATSYLSYTANKMATTYDVSYAIEEVEKEVNEVLFGWKQLL